MPPAKRVVWSPSATQDLWEIWRYYARVGSPEIADRILRDIAGASDALGERHNLGRKRDEIVKDLRSVNAQAYTIFYRVRGAPVEIIRVLHERRDFPGSFLRRSQAE
jgi:toxin ParE1/3/4